MTEQAIEKAGLGLSRSEKFSVLLVYSGIGIATIVGFAASIVVGTLFARLAALGILAYTLGLRHGVDADHIVAIDNTTRKLLQDGERPLTVGTWFSLGHSTVVVGLVVALVVATESVANQIPLLQSSGAIIGTTVSGVFLFLIGLVNAIIVVGIYRNFKMMKEGNLDESELEELLPRLPKPIFRWALQDSEETLAYLPDRSSIRSRLRYRERDCSVRDNRCVCCLIISPSLDGPSASLLVHMRDGFG